GGEAGAHAHPPPRDRDLAEHEPIAALDEAHDTLGHRAERDDARDPDGNAGDGEQVTAKNPTQRVDQARTPHRRLASAVERPAARTPHRRLASAVERPAARTPHRRLASAVDRPAARTTTPAWTRWGGRRGGGASR